MLTKKILLVSMIGLAACVSPEVDLQKAGGICQAGGHQEGTASYQACVSDEVAKIEENRRYTSAAIGGAMQTYSSYASRPVYTPNPVHSPAPMRAPMRCTSNAVGTYTYTNCY